MVGGNWNERGTVAAVGEDETYELYFDSREGGRGVAQEIWPDH